jgi:hypothetical protein
MQIIFRQQEGSVSTNLVSYGTTNTDKDMLLTYMFEWNFPDVEEGTAAVDEAVKGVQKVSKIP